MRIIAGEWRGRSLSAPAGTDTRPTADRTRETLFSMLLSRLGTFDGLRVADLFAGTGALGLEALSRGAAFACFVESQSAAAEAIRRNAQRFGTHERVRIITGSALALPKAEPFDLVFADPPYAPGSGSRAVRSVAEAAWLAPAGWMAIETARSDVVEAGDWKVEAERQVGRARLTLIRYP